MTSLSALFVFCGMISYFTFRKNIAVTSKAWWWLAVSLLVAWPLASFSKENGILLIGYIFLIEIVLLKWRGFSPRQGLIIKWMFIVLLVIPVMAFLVYTVTTYPGGYLSGYNQRDFSLSERLLTQSRVIFFYLGQIALPDVSSMGMFHDDIPISQTWNRPLTTVWALLGLVGIVFVIAYASRKMAYITFGLTFFLLGHSLESTIIPLEMVHEHRNYLPQYGIILMLVMVAYSLLLRRNVKPATIRMVMFLMVVVMAFSTWSRARNWNDTIRLIESQIKHHPRSVKSHYAGGDLYQGISDVIDDSVFREDALNTSLKYFDRAVQLDANFVPAHVKKTIVRLKLGHQPSADELNKLLIVIESEMYGATTVNALRDLFDCELSGICRLDIVTMERLLSAIENNKVARGRMKALIQSKMSQYVESTGRDTGRAVSFALSAVNEQPTVPYRLNLISILIRDGQGVRAVEELQKVIQADIHDRYLDETNALAKVLGVDAKGHDVGSSR